MCKVASRGICARLYGVWHLLICLLTALRPIASAAGCGMGWNDIICQRNGLLRRQLYLCGVTWLLTTVICLEGWYGWCCTMFLNLTFFSPNIQFWFRHRRRLFFFHRSQGLRNAMAATSVSLPLQELLNKPAMAAPTGVHPNFVNPSNLNTEAYVVGAICLMISVIAICIRTWTRTRLNRKIFLEDCSSFSLVAVHFDSNWLTAGISCLTLVRLLSFFSIQANE